MPIAASIRTSRHRTSLRHRRWTAARWSASPSETNAACAPKCAPSLPMRTLIWSCILSSRLVWTTKLFGADVKGRYAELKRASADRCPRQLGTVVKAPEVQFHHEVYNQFLWNLF